jgi:hypothetical protein
MRPYTLKAKPVLSPGESPIFNRVAFAAAHVVVNPFSSNEPSGKPAVDWDRTLAYRHHLLDLGFGIAEAMDTSQRGMGLDWHSAHELARRSLRSAGKQAVKIYTGCGTDHVAPGDARNLDDIVRAYLMQINAIQKIGGRIILMASRALVRVAKSRDDYVKVYSRILRETDEPVILHWLGEMFDPQLAGYWGATTFTDKLRIALQVIELNQQKVDGIKISLLDDRKEIAMRRKLPSGVKMYTGDDFNYPALIAGDAKGYSHALLGIFDAIAPAASQALVALARGDRRKFDKTMAPTVPLSRLIFRSPTQYYKTGIVFLAWLNGHQDHFVMINGAQAMRPLPYFTQLFKLADKAGLLARPDLAVRRMKQLLAIHGA